MLLRTHALPPFVIVDPNRLMPRFWATAWSLSLQGQALSENTHKLRLRHLDAFYAFCDERFGRDSFDDAMSARDAERVQLLLEAFYADLTADPDYTSTTVQRWDSVRGFVQVLARRLAPSSHAWGGLSSLLFGMGKMRRRGKGKFRFIRALPAATLLDLLAVADPASPRNPFIGEAVRWRNWLIVHLLLLAGLRRGEALLLEADSVKSDVDAETGELVYWLDVTTCYEEDPRSTKPSLKTENAHRQIPMSADFALLYEQYVSSHRHPDAHHPYLLTAKGGAPLSAESVTKMFEKLSRALTPDAQTKFFERTGGKEQVSPHDLRHTCATARYSMFMAQDPNRELALQRMRAFFGWSVDSKMPEHYARAAIQEDLLRTWNDMFDVRVGALRGASK